MQTGSSVKVVAPSNLPAGYRLPVTINGETRTVSVPDAVKEGQEFEGVVVANGGNTVMMASSNPHNIPSNAWRDGLCDCCDKQCCHVSCCMAMWLPPIALGQVMTRMKLNACGGTSRARISPFKVMLISLAFMFLLQAAVSYMGEEYRAPVWVEDENGTEIRNKAYWKDDTPKWVKSLEYIMYVSSILYAIYVLIAFVRTRLHIRNRYDIPSNCFCGDLEACWTGMFCQCCGVSQMARHTADFDTYGSSCCGETGLNAAAPPPV